MTRPFPRACARRLVRVAVLALVLALLMVLPPTIASAAAISQAETAVRQLLAGWYSSWQAGDIESYIAFYSNDFRAQGEDRQQWHARKKRLFASGPSSVELSDIAVQIDGATATAAFDQSYASSTLEDFGHKTLRLRFAGDRWWIVGEEWTPAATPEPAAAAEVSRRRALSPPGPERSANPPPSMSPSSRPADRPAGTAPPRPPDDARPVFSVDNAALGSAIAGALTPLPSVQPPHHDTAPGRNRPRNILFGIGELRTSFAAVDGAADLFEHSDEGLPDGWSNRTNVDGYGEGLLGDDTHYTIKAHYDDEDRQDRSILFASLERGGLRLAAGDHPDGFRETVFAAQDEPIRGLSFDATGAALGLELYGGGLRGSVQTDEISADGTSGPYRLQQAPLVPLSERVRIDVRDRSDPLVVTQSRTLNRGRDYNIDYDDGELTFMMPIDDRDFRGDPSVIVVTYSFDAQSDHFVRATWGSRATFNAGDRLRLGVSYLASGPLGNGLRDAIDHSRDSISGDLLITPNDRYRLDLEVSRSNGPVGSDSDGNALRLRFDARPTDRVNVVGSLWRVDRDYLSVGNHELTAGNYIDEFAVRRFPFRSSNLRFDLEPTISANLGPDQQSYALATVLSPFGDDTVEVGFREIRNSLEPDVASGEAELVKQRLFGSWKRIRPGSLEYLIGFEQRQRYDDREDRATDRDTARLVSALRSPLFELGALGPLTGQVAYQLESEDDRISADSSRSHDILGRLELASTPELTLYVEHAERFAKDDGVSDEAGSSATTTRSSERTELSTVGLEGQLNQSLTADLSAIVRRRADRETGQTQEDERVVSLLLRNRGKRAFRYDVRVEYRDLDRSPIGHTQTRWVAGGQAILDLSKSLFASLKYTHEDDLDQSADLGDDATARDDLTLQLRYRLGERLSLIGSWRHERDAIDQVDLDTTDAVLDTLFVGAKLKLSERLDLSTSYRIQMLADSDDENRFKLFVETGYWLNRYLKLGVGYERFGYDQTIGNDRYDSNMFYFNLTGKL